MQTQDLTPVDPMATPEERKSRLQAARRAQTEAPRAPRLDWTGDIPQKTEEPLSDLGQKNYEQQRQKALYGLHGRERELELGRIRKQQSGELRGRALYSREARRQQEEEDKINKEAEKRAIRKYRPGWVQETLAKEEMERNKLLLNESRLQRSANRFPQNPINIPPASTSPTEATRQIRQEDQEEQMEEAQESQKAQLLAGIQAGMNAQTRQQQAQSQQTQQVDEKTRQQREELKQTAKATMRRGAIFVMDSIAAAFDLGSSGISFIIDIFIYIFTLGWLNLEMIYGKYFMKGKSKYVGPISWAPIPMPVDKDAIILSGFVVAADIALGIAALTLTFGGFCILHDMVKVTSSVTQAVSIGASIAQGEAGGLCLGGIITSAFGL